MIITLCLLSADLALHTRDPKLPPNVVVILVDDLGQRDIAPYGSTFYETPNLTRLASQGALFTDAYAACPVCSPTRAAILTGKYPQRTKVTDYLGAVADPSQWKANTKNLPAPTAVRLELSETTIAKVVKAQGYRTFFAGKWHLGGPGFFPTDQGFNVNKGGSERGGPYSGNKYFSPYDNPALSDGPVGEHIDNRLGMETAKFIRDNKDHPFFAYCATYGVHTPLMAKPKLLEKYRAKRKMLDLASKFIQDTTRETRQTQDSPVYAGMVEAVDETVGIILDELKSTNLERDTVVIFTSDNGGLSTSEGWPTSNVPLRKGKGWMYEGGIRVPMIIRWPNVAKAGSKVGTPVASIDLFPTIRAICGANPRLTHSDGADLKSILTSNRMVERDLFWAYPHYGNQGGEPAAAIRNGKWKLIEFEEDSRIELYDLSKDIGEKNNLASTQSKIAKEMLARLATWRKTVGAIRSTKNPGFDPTKPDARVVKRQGSARNSVSNPD